MRGTTNLKIQSTCPDFYDHGEDRCGFLSMADTPVNLKIKRNSSRNDYLYS